LSQAPERAVLLLGFGSPASLDELPQFLARVTGRPVSPEMLDRARARYQRISGSPFLEISKLQARNLEALLNRQGLRWRVFVGFLHSAPSIAEAVGRIVAQSVPRLVGLPFTPFTSAQSTGAYAQAAEAALAQTGRETEFRFIASFHDHPLFLDAVAEKLDQVFWEHPDLTRTNTPVLFTAHSLPKSLPDNETYQAQLEQSRQGVIERLGLGKTTLAFQSRGGGPGAWLEPTIEQIAADFAGRGEKDLVVSPLGFISDHVETLYDLDIEFKEKIAALGLRYFRAASLNDSPRFLEALAELAEARLK
jgi:protoporphyrin/coproporphyrin ferrochelatase